MNRLLWKLGRMFVLVGLGGIPSGGAMASIGSVEVLSQGFLRSDASRSNQLDTLKGQLNLKLDQPAIVGLAEPAFYLNLADPDSFTPEAKNFFIATGPGFSSLHQGTLGRRHFNWSVADEAWKLGYWNPRFVWEPLHPDNVGLTGVFYSYESKHWSLLGYGSYLAIPERGYPVQNVDGTITSSSPDWTEPPPTIILLNQSSQIKYRLVRPPANEIIFRPSAALKTTYYLDGDRNKGFWTSLGYGYLPIHTPDVAVEGLVNANNLLFDATLYPRFRNHHQVALEFGSHTARLSPWVSLTAEKPDALREPANWFTEPTGSSLTLSTGAQAALSKTVSFNTSYIKVWEDQPPPKYADLKPDLPSRFAYRDAIRGSFLWGGFSKFSYELGSVHDFQFDATHVTGGAIYQISNWSVGLGADWVAAEHRAGTIGQYRGNDRLRGALSYVF